MANQFDIKKVIWTCRRGMLELDVILIPFAEQHFEKLSNEQQVVFVQMLEEADPDLFNWLMGHGAPDNSDYATLVSHIRSVMNVA